MNALTGREENLYSQFKKELPAAQEIKSRKMYIKPGIICYL
ncbi:MAG: hypothetical protein ACQEQF_04300 [Bacillota bacterium]